MRKWTRALAGSRQKLLFAAGSLYWTLILIFLIGHYQLVVGTNPADNKMNIMVLFVLIAVVCVSAAHWI